MKKRDVESWLLLIVFWTLGLTVFSQFFFRYFLRSPIGWTEEAARYLLIGVAFLGAMIAVRKGSHITVNFYRYINVPVGMAKIITLAMDILLAFIYAYLAWSSWQMTSIATQKMSSFPLPKSIIYYWVCFCFIGMALHSLYRAKKHWQNPQTSLIGSARLSSSEQKES